MSDQEPKHPDLVRLEKRQAEALAQGYTEGDVNHYVNPIIGMLRRRLRDGEPLLEGDFVYAIDRLHRACNAELAWLAGQEEKQ